MPGGDQGPGGSDAPPDDAGIRTFLIADVRGYTLFTQERGDEAAGKLAAKFARIAREVVEGRGGTLLELRGDEALCVFGSHRLVRRRGRRGRPGQDRRGRRRRRGRPARRLAAKHLGAERIIAMSRHEPRQRLAAEFGATDVVEERGDDGVTRIEELTGGLGAHSVVEAVGTQGGSDGCRCPGLGHRGRFDAYVSRAGAA